MIFIIFVNAIAFPMLPDLLFGSRIPIDKYLDLQFGFSPSFAYETLSDIQENGRMNYMASTILIDIPYTLIYGFVYAFMLILLLKKNNLWQYKYWVFIPFIISISDLLENAGIITMLSFFPEKLDFVSNFTSFFNQSKWSFSLLTTVLVFANLIYWAFRKYKMGKNRGGGL